MSSQESASRREKLRAPPQLPSRGSSLGALGAGANAGVRGVVASRVAAMASAASASTVSSSSSTETTTASTTLAKLTSSYSVDSNSRIPSYRLSSLDRLAQRQRLFEQPANGSTALDRSSAADPTTNAVSVVTLLLMAGHLQARGPGWLSICEMTPRFAASRRVHMAPSCDTGNTTPSSGWSTVGAGSCFIFKSLSST